MKNTPFLKFHEALGARLIPFAGYNMPVEYTGITEEHITVREKAGVFDVSHMGEFWVNGPRALEFLQYITTNDVSALTDGKVQYTCFPNGMGGIVDDLLVYRLTAEKYLLVVNAANMEKDWEWCVKHAGRFGIESGPGKAMHNASEWTAQLAVQGPLALKAMQNTSPIEAGLGWITKFVPGKDFIDRELLLKQKEEGTDRRLKGFIMIDKGIPRQHYEVVDASGNIIGEVTSGTMSPMLKQGIGMAYLNKGFWKTDSEIFIRVRGRDLKAKVVALPFYKQ
ncbi:MAG: hypothetical protein LC630_05505 [Bacteroidales bacterium]|nr:hypothetical protein [Bacteroidales bacterium]